jgi:hypothetical protein
MDIILTGIARSGTTLTCSLLNRLPQCVALHEPMDPLSLARLAYPAAFLDSIGSFFARQRAGLLERGVAESKARDGRVLDNPFGTVRNDEGLRLSMHEHGTFRTDKQLAAGFRLAIKHPAMFTATLAALRTRFPCFAIVRNPLSVLLSWQTIQAAFRDGRSPAAEAFDAELRAALDAEPDRIERQVILLRRSFARYAALLPRDRVIRYEEIVASRGRALAAIDPAAASLDERLEDHNTNSLYDASLVDGLSERLISDESIYAGFYRASDIAEVRDRRPGSR